MASRSRMIALGLAGVAVVGVAGAAAAEPQALSGWPYAGTGGRATAYTLAAVGDIACEPDNAENATTPASLKCGGPTLGAWPPSSPPRSRPSPCTPVWSRCSATSSTR